WDTWTGSQIDAINTFIRAGFEAAVLDHDEPGKAVDSWLCGLALAHIDLEPFQQRLVQPDAARALRELYEWNSYRLLAKGKLANAFWAEHPNEMRLIASWLKSAEVQARIN